jgi:hypothetical protein
MRCGYSDDLDDRDLAMWRGRVASAMRGKRGQKLLRELLAALDEMPEKRLIKDDLVRGGDVCLLGAGGRKRGMADLDVIDPEDHDTLARRFDVAACLVQEIEYVNDEAGPKWKHVDGAFKRCAETPEERYQRAREWLAKHIAV